MSVSPMPGSFPSSPITPTSARGATAAAAPPETPAGSAAGPPPVAATGTKRSPAHAAGLGTTHPVDIPAPADATAVTPATARPAGAPSGTSVPAAASPETAVRPAPPAPRSATEAPPAPTPGTAPTPTPAGEIPLPADLAALRETAVGVLRANDLGDITRPSPTLYPHQWLWDSCFIAIGLRHLDPARAAAELLSLLRGQWPGGMIPHVIFAETSDYYHAGPQRWRCDRVCTTAGGAQSTGVTQPPMIAEAAVRVGEAMSRDERVDFYRRLAPGLIRFHEWLYRERDPDDTGLV
ncbi:MGH1-like glycoside hydrolase domain-containing protein, partial [Frankia sp. EI5c]|uniref:MGH1-like glycoside hydrolase domain-containing protein n=1 Tax=Frankia sp. EI5c TaxID=683316 RepID=UPI0037BF3BD6